MHQTVPHPNGSVVAIEPWEQNYLHSWPKPQLATVREGKIELANDTEEPITLGVHVKSCKIWTTEESQNNDDTNSYYKFSNMKVNEAKDGDENMKEIRKGDDIEENAKEMIDKAHNLYNSVFNKDLSVGYNGYYGKHECALNWASSERPAANKVKVPSYGHDLKGLQQELMDELTNQGVLLVPQEHDIIVQSVCPSFIQRKQRAKDKPKHLLTKDDIRLLINFGPINDKIKPVPIHVTKTDDVLISLGRWKQLIMFDLFNGYFQNHMRKDAIPWLGVQTPFGGLRVISRSGQGLAGMAEEFNELTSKVLKDELQEGICFIIVDDLYVGGETQLEAATNYLRILSKMHNANLKVTPEKTHIFPKSVDVLGWVWNQGGFLKASPHRTCSLQNTKVSDVKKIKDMRSWVGLFKTLHIVTPNISTLLAPFEAATAGRETNENFEWSHNLEIKFKQAKIAISTMKTLYLPSPEDQLLLLPDASKGGIKGEGPAGIGHILYAIKDGKKLPVRVHSAKLKEACKRWSPCELEALACGTAIEKEYDLIRESKKPLIVCPDSKPVHEAVNLVNKGHFSTSSRMSSFLTNINRLPVQTSHISGKARLNPVADHQSRFPSECTSEVCSVCKFIDETIASVLEPAAKNCSLSTTNAEGFASRSAWKQAQNENQACQQAKHLLTTGKPPPKAAGKHSGELWNDIRQYFRDATVAKDGLLVVKSLPETLSGNVSRERIVIPKTLAPSLLYHLHNHSQEHPQKTQQKAKFQRQFYAVGLDKHLENLYKHCYKCSVLIKLPREAIQNETKTKVEAPHSHFHADVIKRASQNILTIKDHFSSFQDAMLIPSEKAEDLKQGIIILTSGLRHPNMIFISPDNSPGFTTLVRNQDKELQKLKVSFVKTDELNKNANAVIDRGCQELEEEIKRLSPEGEKISIATLKLATLNLNSKLRRRGNISAFEINSSRDQNTGEHLSMNDEKLRTDQLQVRKANQVAVPNSQPVLVGDTVSIKNKTDKHKVNDMFIVTSKTPDKIKVQKLLHPLKETPGKIMSKTYETDEKRLRVIHRPAPIDDSDDDEIFEDDPIAIQLKKPNSWNPIDSRFFSKNQDDDDDDDVTSDEQQPADYNDSVNNSPVNAGPEEPEEGASENADELASEEYDDDQLEWDSSPEQYQLNLSTDDHRNDDIDHALRPRILFPNDQSDPEPDSLTSEASSEVFNVHDVPTPATNSKLLRNNAFRKRVRPPRRPRTTGTPPSLPRITRSQTRESPVSHEGSVPRVTRSSIRSISAPTTPSQVIPDQVQLLHRVLPQHDPVVPEVVQLGPRVQRLDRALQHPPVLPEGRPRRSTRRDIDYLKYDETGDKE